jgi:ribonuclease VapC
MILDSSAVLAILFHESDAKRYADAIEATEVRRISAPTYVELSIVVESQNGPSGLHDLEHFIRQAAIVVEPFTAEQAHLAQRGWSNYGRGQHPAKLNFGDCFSYALAKSLDEPLLFKGGDFSKTDVEPAIRP